MCWRTAAMLRPPAPACEYGARRERSRQAHLRAARARRHRAMVSPDSMGALGDLNLGPSSGPPSAMEALHGWSGLRGLQH